MAQRDGEDEKGGGGSDEKSGKRSRMKRYSERKPLRRNDRRGHV